MKKNQYISLATLLLTCSGCTPACDPCVETTYVHQYGVRVDPEYWTSTGQNGEVITSHRDGTVETRTYRSGVLHGPVTMTFCNSDQIKYTEEYDNDACVKRTTYLECGTPEQTIEYPSEGCWVVTMWYNSGSPRCVERYERGILTNAEYFDPQHNRESWVYNGQGERMYRDRFGQFLYLDTIGNGYLQSRTNYHPNGSVREVIPYDQQGNISGLKRTYNPDGSPNTIETWSNNQQQGTTTIFLNGERFAEVPYLSGKKNGLERRFTGGDIVSQEITWNDNQMHGPTFLYTGDSVQSDWYYKGRLTTRSNFESFNMPRRAIN